MAREDAAACVEINQCVGCSAMTRPSWLGRAVRNRHRHAIEACVDGVEVDAAIQRERAVTFDFHTGNYMPDIRA